MKPRSDTLVVCVGVFVVLAWWIFTTYATGEVDSTLHFLNARDAIATGPEVVFTSWARPLFKALIIGPAWLGVEYARLTIALLAALLVGQTIGLARDLKLQRPLLAGFFLIAQPATFFVAQDTLTEIPMALMVYGALRLWMHERRALSCLLISLTPAVRPEGYFFIALWAGLLALDAHRHGARRLLIAPLLAVGVAAWVGACWLLMKSPLHPFWSFWPIDGWGYGKGSLWDYAERWPWFLGSALFPLFIIGLRSSLRRELALVWVIWGLVFVLHSILWWRGLFASAGLMRILVTTAPSAALVCLCGFNTVAGWLEPRLTDARVRVALTAAFLAWAAFVTRERYRTEREHLEAELARAPAEFLLEKRLLPPGTQLFMSNRAVLYGIDYPKKVDVELVENKWGHDEETAVLKGLRSGAIGVWDNGYSNSWVGITSDDIEALGFERLAEFSSTVELSNAWYMYKPWKGPDVVQIQYVVFRKR